MWKKILDIWSPVFYALTWDLAPLGSMAWLPFWTVVLVGWGA